MPPRYRIGVVGFGVGGATVSHLLAQAGHHVELFERAPRVGPVGAGILLQPSGQLVLARLGLLERVAALGEPIERLHALTHRGKTLIDLPYAELGAGIRAFGLHRGELFSVLHERVAAAGVNIRLDHEIVSCAISDDRVQLRDRRGREHGPFHFVVAADGSRSTLRGACRLRKWIHEYEYGALWALGRCTRIRGRLHQVVRGTHDLAGLLPMGDGRCSLFWSLRRSDHDALLQRGYDAWKADVLRLAPDAEELFDSVTSFAHTAFTTYQHVWMRSWHDDYVLFLGDAAHAMSPHLGQGINLALIDGWTFATILEQSADYREAFRRHTRARRRHNRLYSIITFLLAPFFQSGGFIKGLGRDIALPLMTRIPPIRRQMILTMAGLKSGFFGGAWSLERDGK